MNATVQAPGRKGDNLPRIPGGPANFSVQYEHSLEALPDWSAWVRGDWSYHGKSHTELRPTAATDRVAGQLRHHEHPLRRDAERRFGSGRRAAT